MRVNLEGVLRRQAGVISRQQALTAGLSTDQVDWRLATGRWVAVYPGVYVAADRECTGEARIRAAGLWAAEPSTISGVAAAWWHGLWTDPPSLVEITLPSRRRLHTPSGIRIRRALQRRVRFDSLHRAHCRNAGRRGSTLASSLLTAAADRAASAAERKLLALLRAAHLTGWIQHYRLSGYELDFAFPDHRVAIEVDGWAWHSDVGAFRTDRQRQNAVALAGWTVLRFTWHDLTQRPNTVVHEIRAAVS